MSGETVDGAVAASGSSSRLQVVGGGPAGLVAALTVARAGREVTVSERHSDVGRRFHGLEN